MESRVLDIVTWFVIHFAYRSVLYSAIGAFPWHLYRLAKKPCNVKRAEELAWHLRRQTTEIKKFSWYISSSKWSIKSTFVLQNFCGTLYVGLFLACSMAITFVIGSCCIASLFKRRSRLAGFTEGVHQSKFLAPGPPVQNALPVYREMHYSVHKVHFFAINNLCFGVDFFRHFVR